MAGWNLNPELNQNKFSTKTKTSLFSTDLIKEPGSHNNHTDQDKTQNQSAYEETEKNLNLHRKRQSTDPNSETMQVSNLSGKDF